MPQFGLSNALLTQFIGDNILVQPIGSEAGRWYQGFVHFVRQLEVGLRFNASFGYTPEQRCKVRFKLNRYPLRRQHQALDSVLHSDRILFPTSANLTQTTVPSVAKVRARIFNKLIATNPAQLQAVATIVDQPRGSPPLGLFGP